MSEEDAFIPETEVKPNPDAIEDEIKIINLADDEELCRKVLDHIDYNYDKHKTNRTELDKIWEIADDMFKCGQNQTQTDTERKRMDRSGDDIGITNTVKFGSTLFFRQIRSLASQFVAVVESKKDPFTFTSRYNPDLYDSPEQADELANQHNLMMRWTRDADNFPIKNIELAYQLFKYGNQPIYMGWKKRSAEILDRYKQADGSTKVERRTVNVDNRPSFELIQNELFYADINLPIQKQNCIVVKSSTNPSIARGLEADGEFLNTDKIDATYLYTGGDDNLKGEKDKNAGLPTETDDTNTGTLIQFDAHALLPIDPDAPKGKRWNEEKFEPKKYWVTIVSPLNPVDGLCMRIERNRDPDDEFPFEMLSSIPDDSDRLYKVSLAQILRSNFYESTVTKQQIIDDKTLRNNRPLKIKRGAVTVKDNDFSFGKDKAYMCDDPDKDISEFTMQSVGDNLGILTYLDNDSDEASGNNRAARGDPMGGRTSSAEATNAFDAANRPQMMIIKYILNKYLMFYARKGVRLWHIYARDDQYLQISDEEQYPVIRPADMYGDFHVNLTLVDDYEKNFMQQQGISFAAQNLFPIFQQYLDMRGLAIDVFDKVMKLDVSRHVLPDRSDEFRIKAGEENRVIMEEGRYISPSIQEDLQTMLKEHRGARIQYNGVEDQFPNVALLDRHIQETEFLIEQQAAQAPVNTGSPEAPPQVETNGEAVGEQIAGIQGQLASGSA